jgi:hypothetical protein
VEIVCDYPEELVNKLIGAKKLLSKYSDKYNTLNNNSESDKNAVNVARGLYDSMRIVYEDAYRDLREHPTVSGLLNFELCTQEQQDTIRNVLT